MPTLPSNLILNPPERAEIERHVAALQVLCEQTPLASADWEAATLVVVTKLMLALPSTQQNELGAEASGEAFMAALEDIPGPSRLRLIVGTEETAATMSRTSHTTTDGDQLRPIFER